MINSYVVHKAEYISWEIFLATVGDTFVVFYLVYKEVKRRKD